MTKALQRHKLVRNAKASIEDILRKSGSSVDGSHSQSSFLSTKGDFIGSGDTHIDQILNLNNKTDTKIHQDEDTDVDGIINEFSQEHGIPRVQHFTINRAGEKKTNFGINSKINSTQLKTILDTEKGGRTIGYNISNSEAGSGGRNLVKALREYKLL